MSISKEEREQPQNFNIIMYGETRPLMGEDSTTFYPQLGYAAVFDGAGGMQNGMMASRTAEQVLKESLSLYSGWDVEDLSRKISDSLIKASKEVMIHARGGATTATVLKVMNTEDGRIGVIGYVGDSRAYLLRSGELSQLTQDDDLLCLVPNVSEEKKQEIRKKLDNVRTWKEYFALDRFETVMYDRRNEVSRVLGADSPGKDVEPHIYTVKLMQHDRIYITSDGVHDNLSYPELVEAFTNEIDMNMSVISTIKSAFEKSQEGTRGPRTKKDDISIVGIEIL